MADAKNNNEDIEQLSPEAEAETAPITDLSNTEDTDMTFGGLVDRDTGMGRTLEELDTGRGSEAGVTGGDIDDNSYQAEVVGEEAVGGLTPTPDQNVTEDLQESMGIESADEEPVQTADKLDRRDENRWELDPKSSQDYQQRRE